MLCCRRPLVGPVFPSRWREDSRLPSTRRRSCGGSPRSGVRTEDDHGTARAPAPGSRRDHYRFREGIDATGSGTPTARRLREMQDFYTFMARELPPAPSSWGRTLDTQAYRLPALAKTSGAPWRPRATTAAQRPSLNRALPSWC